MSTSIDDVYEGQHAANAARRTMLSVSAQILAIPDREPDFDLEDELFQAAIELARSTKWARAAARLHKLESQTISTPAKDPV